MKITLEKQLSQYFKEIKKNLPVNHTGRNEIMASIKQNVNDFLTTYPNASFEDIVAEFGSAADVAASFSHTNDSVGAQFHSVKKKHFRFASSFTLFIVIAVLVLSIFRFCINHLPFIPRSSTVIYDGTEIPYDDYMDSIADD